MKRANIGVVVCLLAALAACGGHKPSPVVRQAQDLLDAWEGDGAVLAQARSLLDRALAENPRDPDALVAMARYYVASGMISTNFYEPAALKSAQQQLDLALAIDPEFAPARLEKGFVLMHGFDPRPALAELKKAEQLDPDDPLVNVALAHLHVLSARWKEAAQEVRIAEEKSARAGSNARVTRRIIDARMDVHRGLDDYEALSKDYEESLQVSPNSAWVHGNYAVYQLKEKGNTDIALAEAEKALSLMQYGGARETLALARYAKWAVLQASDPALAGEFYASAQALQPDLERAMGSASQAAARNPDLAVLVSALKAEGVSVDAPDRNGDTAMIRAVNAGDVGTVAALITDGADVNQKDFMQRTPLILATFRRDAALVETLVSNGADLEIGDEYGRRPLHLAALEGEVEIARILIAHKADLNAKGFEDATPLLVAAQTDNLDLVKLLVQSGADTNAQLGGANPGDVIQVAQRAGRAEIAAWLQSQQASAH